MPTGIIEYTEEMVGKDHPTKADTLNRGFLIDHGNDGQHTLSGFQGSQFAADAEASDTYVITLAPVPAAYFTGMVIVMTCNTANTGAATLNVNALGAKTIKKLHDQDLETGDIESGQVVVLVYDGTNFQMQSQRATFFGNAADKVITRGKFLDSSETVNAIGAIGGGAQAIDLELGNVVTGTVDTSETTFTFTNPPTSGDAGAFLLILTNGGSQTVNWPASVDWAGGSAPSLTSSGVDLLVFVTVDGGTIWHGADVSLNSS